MKIKVSKDPDTNWRNDAIQFPRLIAEAEAIGMFTTANLNRLANEMDLTVGEVMEIINRAQAAFDKIKYAP